MFWMSLYIQQKYSKALLSVPHCLPSFYWQNAAGQRCCLFSGSRLWSSSLSVYRRRRWVKRGPGVIWLGEVTMRYGGEGGRLFDTATRCCCAVMYNGNTSERAESRMVRTHTHTHTQRKLHTNCTQIELMGYPSIIWTTKHQPLCVFRIKISVWSLWKYHMEKNNVQGASVPNCIEPFSARSMEPFLLPFRIW